jgi:hypothetical protein
MWSLLLRLILLREPMDAMRQPSTEIAPFWRISPVESNIHFA